MSVSAEVDDRIDKCQKLLRTDPNSQIFAALAEAHRKKGELGEAFRVCQNGLRIHSTYGSAHVVMAKINLDRGLFDWAEAEVQKAVEIDGRNRAVELLMAEINISKGEFDKALTLLKSLHQADPNNRHIEKLLEITRKIPEEQKAQRASANNTGTLVQEGESSSDNKDRKVVEVSPRCDPPAILKEAVAIKDLEGALYINLEGLIVESEWTLPMNAENCGAQLAGINHFLTQALTKANFGVCHAVLIESTGPVFYLCSVKEGYFLFVASHDIVLGTLRMRVGSLMKRFKVE